MKILSIILLFSLLPILPSYAAQDEVQKLTSQGNESFTRGEFDAAAKLYSKALKIEAKNPVILYNQANVLFQQEKYAEALAKYKESLKATPPRHLIGNIYFNAGNTALKLANLQTKDKQGLEELQKSISYYETSFNMYRKSLAQARAVSIAEGRNVNDAGRSAKKNWALARESWTAALDQMRALQKKNMTLEDGIKDLLTAQSNLLPTLEGVFLNSLSEDTLKFNLKKLAEYQLDYKEEIATLRSLAAKQEEETQTKIANLKTSTPASKPGAPTPSTAQDADSPESVELQQQLTTAQEIKKAVQQAAALDEWIVDNLKKNQAMEAWQNAHKMVDLLEDLSSFLEGNDPILNSYQNGLNQLEATEILLRQAENLAKINDNENATRARTRRTTLAEAKTSSAAAALTKINFYLDKIKEGQEKEAAKSQPPPATAKDTKKTLAVPPKDPASMALRTALTNIKTEYLEELHGRNQKMSTDLQDISHSFTKKIDTTITENLARYRASLIWYQQLDKSVSQLASALIKDSATAEDILNTILETAETTDKKDTATKENPQLASLPNEEQMNILLFQLDKIGNSLAGEQETNDTAAQVKKLQQSLTKGLKQLRTSWQKTTKLRNDLAGNSTKTSFLDILADLRLALMRNLLIFSPDMAINLYFERSAELQQHLLEILPVQPGKIATITKRYHLAISEAAGLNSLLVSYLDNLQKSVNAIEGEEKQKTYQESLTKRQKAIPFIQRLIDAGQSASALLAAKKFQESELLYKDMPGSLQKSRLVFSEQPKEAEKALTIAIDLQKKLAEQSRGASEAIMVEGESEKLVSAITANQNDISNLSDNAIILLQNMIGMADIPTHGQDPKAKTQDPKKVDTKKIKEAIDKVGDAQVKMAKNSAFLKAGEFQNTFSKHQEIIDLLQEALDLLKNKDEKKEDKKGDKKDDKKKENKDQKKNKQNQQQKKQQQDGAGRGKSQPKKPLEMSPQEARELLKQLNKQDEKQQHRAIPSSGTQPINTPRPW